MGITAKRRNLDQIVFFTPLPPKYISTGDFLQIINSNQFPEKPML
jgi:hypothetical protein